MGADMISSQENDEKKGSEDASADAAGEGEPLRDITNTTSDEAKGDKDKKNQTRPQRERRERGPPADGIPSKTKVMVANLPYDLTEEKVSCL